MYYVLLNKRSETLVPILSLHFNDLQTTYLCFPLGLKGFMPSKGFIFLIVSTNLIADWILNFNNYVDTKEGGLYLVFIYNFNPLKAKI